MNSKENTLLAGFAVVAVGDTSIAEGYLHELQSGTKLHKPSTKPEPSRLKEKESNSQNKHHTELLLGG